MIPRALPKLLKDALHAGWNVRVYHDKDKPLLVAEFTHWLTEVRIVWDAEGRTHYSAINGTPTPYRQCVALLKNPEGAPE